MQDVIPDEIAVAYSRRSVAKLVDVLGVDKLPEATLLLCIKALHDILKDQVGARCNGALCLVRFQPLLLLQGNASLPIVIYCFGKGGPTIGQILVAGLGGVTIISIRFSAFQIPPHRLPQGATRKPRQATRKGSFQLNTALCEKGLQYAHYTPLNTRESFGGWLGS